MKILKTAKYVESQSGARMPANIRKRLGNQIINLTQGYHDQIPLGAMFDVLKSEGFIPLQEGGTEWSGMLIGGAECGSDETRDQVANFPLAQRIGNELVPVSNCELYLSWCKMSESGKYEITAYLT